MTSYELLKKLEWVGPRVHGYYDAKLYHTCLVCGAMFEFGHAPDCALNAVLKRKVVEVEIPEPDKDTGFCSIECPFLARCEDCDEEGKGWAIFVHTEYQTWLGPGPGCPWYSKKGDEDGNTKD